MQSLASKKFFAEKNFFSPLQNQNEKNNPLAEKIIQKNFCWSDDECGQNIFFPKNKDRQFTKADKIFKNFLLDWIKK